MDSQILVAESRTVVGKQVRQLRREGKIPGIVYGHKTAARNFSVDAHTFAKLFGEVGSTSLVDLTIDGKSAGKVLIHDVQVHAIKRVPEHVDLFAVNLKEKLRTMVPLVFIGSDDIDVEGGMLQTVKDEVEVECLPGDLVQEMKVDLSALQAIGDHVTVSSLVAPKGVTIIDEGDELIASITETPSGESLDLESEIVQAEVPAETEEGHEAPADAEK
jgi:large subunit ribosomal protein L25